MPQTVPYISNLTPVRGIAALLVVLFHFQVVFGILVDPASSHLIAKGYLMVDLFFILSGIVMTHVYSEYFSARVHWPSYKRYIVARIARIYPLHILTLCAVIVAVYLFGVWEMFAIPSDLLPNILLIHSVHTTSGLNWNVPSWSISAEWISYLIFPILLPVFSKRTLFSLLVYYLIILSGYWLTLYFLTAPPYQNTLQDVTWNFGFLRGVLGFFSGVIIYQYYQSARIRNFFSKDFMLLTTIIFIFFILHKGSPDIWAIILFPFFLLTVMCNAGKLKYIFNWKPMQKLGDISYSIYMWHAILCIMLLIVIKYFKIPYGGFFLPNPFNFTYPVEVIFCICFLVVLLGMSLLSFHFVERPLRNYINQKANAPKTRSPLQISGQT